MSTLRKSHLSPVVAMVDQSIDLTIDLLTNHTKNPEQLMLNVSKEEVLRQMQSQLHLECDADNFDGKKVWCLVNTITATIVAYVMETMSDSKSYQFCCEWRTLAVVFGKLIHSQLLICKCEYWVYKSWIWERSSNYLGHPLV